MISGARDFPVFFENQADRFTNPSIRIENDLARAIVDVSGGQYLVLLDFGYL